MIATWITCGVLAAILVITLFMYIRLKHDIRQLEKRLCDIMKIDTNTKLTTTTFDKDASNLANTVNTLLAKSRSDFYNLKRLESDLKRAIINISHDLRTPLTSAKGYLQMLTDSAPEDASRYLEIISGRLEMLAMLMDNLFAFSKAMDGVIKISSVNISNVLRDALSDSYVELESKGFVVEASIPDVPVKCLCDEGALKRILQNLLKNVYVHGKDYVHVGLYGHTIKIANKADELGMLDTDCMFDRFYTADAARSQKRTGLGLAISKELVVRMGGSIKATHIDDMLTICVSLPPTTANIGL